MSYRTYTIAELSGLILAYHDQVRNGNTAEFPVRRSDHILPDEVSDRQTIEQALDRYFEYVIQADGTYIVTGVLTKLI